ncbi:STAS domain-containing protein [Mucisphaera sp.]|uniref:STAS domain-containing protein n=1 Tax=Mucisphaera sp. TaxID=2913024 RepID=UPI003D0C887C
MKIKRQQQQQDLGIIALIGDPDPNDADRLRREAKDHLGHHGRDIIIDLNQARGLNSRTLETLLAIQEEVSEHLGRLILANTPAVVEQILHVTRLNQRFEQVPTLDDAVARLREAA